MFTYKWYSKILRSSLLLQVPDLSDSEFLDPSNVFIVVTIVVTYLLSYMFMAKLVNKNLCSTNTFRGRDIIVSNMGKG